jgi:3'-phosphoadenosine 5'-phosphosulfate sulfotransferase (PAPS reductase)/FAD synthetase
MTSEQIKQAAQDLETATAADILKWASTQFPSGRLTFATSLGLEDCVMTDLIARQSLPIELFTLDTQLLFPETYALWDEMQRRYGVTITAVGRSTASTSRRPSRGRRYGRASRIDAASCARWSRCERSLSGYDAWITAIRRDQTPDRANAPGSRLGRSLRSHQGQPARPLDVGRRPRVRRRTPGALQPAARSALSQHRLHACTSQVMPGEDPRSGRWRGKEKTECGLHMVKVKS